MTAHTGAWHYHDDDCQCAVFGGAWCNRGGWCWSCCGACGEHTECSAPRMHPTHWAHPKWLSTHAGHEGGRPVYKPNEAIRTLVPEAFDS